MIRQIIAGTVLAAILAITSVLLPQLLRKHEIAEVRQAIAYLQSTPAARAAGYELVPGLDYCFQSYGVGGMGYHYIKRNLIDTSLDLLQPEALVYAPDANGSLELGAVEYVAPAAAWDIEHSEPPQILGQRFHLSEKLGAYVLAVWIWKDNPAGMFEDWNPDVFCPEPLQWNGPSHWR